MTLWIGRRQAIGIGLESSRGVGVVPTYWLSVNNFTFADTPQRALSEASFGGIWGGDQAPVTLLSSEGEFDVQLGDRHFGVILKALMGTLATTGPTDTAAYTHTYTLLNTNEHPSISISTIDPIGNLIFELAMINSFTLNIQPNEIVTYTASFLAKGSQDTGSGLDDSYGAEKTFVGRMLTFKTAATTASLAAASKVNLKSLTLTIEKNAEVQATLATIQPEDIANRRFNVMGEVSLNYEDRTFLNFVRNGNYRAVRIQLTHDDTITGAASTKYSWTFDLSKCAFEEWEPDFTLDEIVTQSLTFNALYDAGGNDNLINSCILVNGVSSY